MLKEYCLWESQKLPLDAVKVKVARPSVLGVPKDLWEKWQRREISWKDYERAYLHWVREYDRAWNRLALIALMAKESWPDGRGRDVYLGCYCRRMPCHRFTLLTFLVTTWGCQADPGAVMKYRGYLDPERR